MTRPGFLYTGIVRFDLVSAARELSHDYCLSEEAAHRRKADLSEPWHG
ncbi:MAG: hypothetical protein L3K26_19740 [Candidatus Hydrogenedentes bacterium]|nr:hypothetical protein [Candidatus Hydrogenedentota bacterium]